LLLEWISGAERDPAGRLAGRSRFHCDCSCRSYRSGWLLAALFLLLARLWLIPLTKAHTKRPPVASLPIAATTPITTTAQKYYQ